MLIIAYIVGGWVQKSQKSAYVIYGQSLIESTLFERILNKKELPNIQMQYQNFQEDSPLGTVHILRKHFLGLFWTHPPTI